MTEGDARRFANIRRGAQYGVTRKDLAWLIAMVEKLDRLASARAGMLPPRSPSTQRESSDESDDL
jgi:hypothetical protein